jgi:hypothetical protein
MKLLSNLRILDVFPDYIAFKYERMSRVISRPVSLTIGMDIDNNGHITSYHCCNEYRTFKEAKAEADKVIIPFKPSTIWR